MHKTLKRGKVLKVRLGYNANSSSLSAMVTMIMLGSAAAVAVIGMITTVLLARKGDPDKAAGGDAA
jgi:hypothetical protein